MASDLHRLTTSTTTQQQRPARHKHQAHLTISTEHATHGRHEAEPLKVNFGREAPPKRKPPRIALIARQLALHSLGVMGGAYLRRREKYGPKISLNADLELRSAEMLIYASDHEANQYEQDDSYA